MVYYRWLLSDIISTNLLCLILALPAGADEDMRGVRHRVTVSVTIIRLIYIIIVHERESVCERVCMSTCKICLREYGLFI